ncbi:Transcription factor TFIIIB component B [Thoreauomyces humboldtii]|nr:Transcription factor TFIIIB component B [Thoreauomyces humboldtii]
MVELTLSSVNRGPGKAPKLKPRIKPRGPAAAITKATASTALPSTPPVTQQAVTEEVATRDAASQEPLVGQVPSLADDGPVLATPPPSAPEQQTSSEDSSAPAEPVSETIAKPNPSSLIARPVAPVVIASPVTASIVAPAAPISTPAIPISTLPAGATTSSEANDRAERNPEIVVSRRLAPPSIGSTISASAIQPPSTSTHTGIPFVRSNAPPRILSTTAVTEKTSGGFAIIVPARQTTIRPVEEPQAAAVGGTNGAEDGEDEEEARDEEEAEVVELDEYTIPTTSLVELIKHKFSTGRLSTAERLRQEAAKEARAQRRSRSRSATPVTVVKEATPVPDEEEEEAPPMKQSGPRLIMIDGKLQLDKNSLHISADNDEEEDLEEIAEDSNRRINSASFGKKPLGRVRWTSETTNRFYEGLSHFGTDFGLISLMFPELNRRQIKAKYNAEERCNARRVTATLLRKRVASSDLAGEMKERLKERVQKRKAANNESDDDEEVVIAKRTKTEALKDGIASAAKLAESEQAADAPSDDEDAPEEVVEEVVPRPPTLEELQAREDEMGAPTVQEQLELSLPRSTAAIKPRIGPKIVPRKRKVVSVQNDAAAKKAAQEAAEAAAAAAAAQAEAAMDAPGPVPPMLQSRVRAVPKIGIARKT